MNVLSKSQIEIACENCGNKFSVSLLQIAKQKIISCSKCSTNIHLVDKGGKTKQALRKMENIEQLLKKLSKNK